MLFDAESVINSIQLTYVADDDDDLGPLTPAMFLQGIKDSKISEFDIIDSRKMRKSFAYQQKVRKDLRKGFRVEYL